MIFKRKIYQDLLKWKNESNGESALLIEGARRIGKSTIVEEFAKNEYESYIIIDFSKADEDFKDYFVKYINNLDTLFMLIQARYKIELKPRKSLVVFDEVQFCTKARQAIKHLVKDGRYDYIETGSLISIHENVKDILIPSEEDSIDMYPLNFEEFLWAMGEKPLSEYIQYCFKNLTPLENSLHDKAMLLFKEYMLVGGMPKSLSDYIENHKSFSKSDKRKLNILNLYRKDIMGIESNYKTKVKMIFDSIPGFLSKHEKRVMLKQVHSNSRYDFYDETFFWLADSKICNECFLCNDPNVGLSLNEDRSFVKCYMGDTGLLVTMVFNESKEENKKIYNEIILGNISINNGMFFENIVAQTLVSNGYKIYFYTHYNEEKHRNDIEIDFIISNNSSTHPKIYPIEVKSGMKYQTKSLDKFVEKYKDRIGAAYVIHPRNLSIKENGTICIPAYMTFCL